MSKYCFIFVVNLKQRIMTTSYFKAIGQKMGDGKVAIMMVMDEHTIAKDLPTIFELQAAVMPKTIYTGTQPNIKFNLESLEDLTEEFTGMGLAGIFTSAGWYNKDIKSGDPMGISLD